MKPSRFKNGNSCGLARHFFWEPDFLTPDLAVGSSVLAGGTGFLTLLPQSTANSAPASWPCVLGHVQGQEPNNKEDKWIPSQKAWISP